MGHFLLVASHWSTHAWWKRCMQGNLLQTRERQGPGFKRGLQISPKQRSVQNSWDKKNRQSALKLFFFSDNPGDVKSMIFHQKENVLCTKRNFNPSVYLEKCQSHQSERYMIVFIVYGAMSAITMCCPTFYVQVCHLLYLFVAFVIQLLELVSQH